MTRRFWAETAWGLFFVLALTGGTARAAATQAEPADFSSPAYQGFFAEVQTSGKVAVKLHPHPQVVGRKVRVSFGVPFPPGFVTSTAQLALKNFQGREFSIFVKVLARWPQPMLQAGSLRAVLVQVELDFTQAGPLELEVGWGAPRTMSLARGWPPRSGWLPVEAPPYPRGAIKEPPVFATFPPRWLGICLLKGRSLPFGTYAPLEWQDAAWQGFFKTKTHRGLDPRVEKRFLADHGKEYRPWQYDFATVLFLTYFRGGKLVELREAHRAAQYYATQIEPDGRFALMPRKYQRDLKYSHIECLMLDYWLTGDDRVGLAMSRLAQMLSPDKMWNPFYSLSRTFWTERHLSYQLLNSTALYEATGDPEYLDLARLYFNAGFALQDKPVPGAPKDTGCLVHTAKSHSEGKGWVCSPWMNVLLVGAMQRYYIVTGDVRVPIAVKKLAGFTLNHGTYRAKLVPRMQQEFTFPKYLVCWGGPDYLDGWINIEHTLNVSKIPALAWYFTVKEGKPNPAYRKLAFDLLVGTKFKFSRYFAGKNMAAHGFPEWTLGTHPAQARRFNWWFRPTADLGWLLSHQ